MKARGADLPWWISMCLFPSEVNEPYSFGDVGLKLFFLIKCNHPSLEFRLLAQQG
jgi:hypothetical protein